MKISSKGKRDAAAVCLRAVVACAAALFTFKENLLLAASPADGSSRLAALLAANASEIARMKVGLAAGESRPEWTRLRASIDAAAHQRDAAWSGLYWYTNLPEALAAAKREGKQVLSLRLLGNLDEELSCANSRYFRTVLYANTAVSDELRRNWILHWESVRPAPKVTIDFGDGRKLVRTITGNSLHYVLDTNGKARDVFPGLWEPEEFLRMLKGAAAALDRPGGAHSASSTFKANLSSLSSSSLDPSSISLMRTKVARVGDAAFDRMVASFERTLSEDMAGNAAMRLAILPWLRETATLPALTERIYREAFLTPRSDPWLGLVVPDTYAAIEGDPAPSASGPDARKAGALAASKMIVERPLLAKVAPAPR
jgi:hypothetical protein